MILGGGGAKSRNWRLKIVSISGPMSTEIEGERAWEQRKKFIEPNMAQLVTAMKIIFRLHACQLIDLWQAIIYR